MTITPAQIETRARSMYAEMFTADPVRACAYEGKMRNACLQLAREALEREEAEAPIRAQLAAMSDDELEANIAMCDFEVAGRYAPETIQSYRDERRLYVTEQLRRSVARGAHQIQPQHEAA